VRTQWLPSVHCQASCQQHHSQPHTSISLQVAAYNANGDVGARSASSAAFLLGTVAPSVPLAAVAASATPLTAALSFQAPALNGGTPITG